MVRSQPFDLVLLDVMMPELNGYQVSEAVKADLDYRHLPVIMISALDEIDSVVRCIEAGAEDYLSKPFNPTLLRARIGASLEKKRLRDRERALPAADRGREAPFRQAPRRDPAPRDCRGIEGDQLGPAAPL